MIGSTLNAQLLTPEVLYYDFNGSGTSVPNLASAPPPGTATATIMGGVTQGGSGICEGTLIGTGVSASTDYLNTGWATNLGTGSWTIAWRSEGISTNATLYYIFGDGTANSFRCFTNGVAGSTNWIIRGGGLTDTYINGGALATSTHCAFVYDAVANQVRGYLNGVLVTTVNQTAPNITGTGPFKVMGYNTNVGAPAGGMLDEFRVYSRALTPTEVAQLNNPWVPSGYLGADQNICSGSPLVLSLPYPVGTVLWSTGSTSTSTTINSSQLVTVQVSGDCGTGNDTVDIILGLPTYDTISAIACGSYTAPSGAVYTMSGTYNDTLVNVAGCDSVITINVNVTQPSSSSINQISCISYTSPSGLTYFSSGTYMDTILNTQGCDSVITINLTINQPSAATISANACDMYTAPSGAMYMASGMYNDTIANMMGCDSVITINLTITNSTSSTINATACGMYILPDGDTAMASGMYMSTIPNMAGCDSVITSNVTINTATSSTMTASACTSFMAPSGAQYTNSGTYLDTIPNMAGCDSVITINLTIFNLPAVTLNIANNAVCVDDASMTLTGGSPAGGTYSGPGVTGNSFSPVSAGNGTHAIVYTYVDSNGCSNTASANITVSPCVGINENTGFAGINLYPNPNTGTFVIDLGANYEDVSVVVSDLAGRTVHAQNANNANLIPVEFDSAAGMYIVTVVSGSNKASFQLIRQ